MITADHWRFPSWRSCRSSVPSQGHISKKKRKCYAGSSCVLDLLSEAEPPGKPASPQHLQDQRCFPSPPGEELLAWPAEQSSVLQVLEQPLATAEPRVGASCCRKSQKHPSSSSEHRLAPSYFWATAVTGKALRGCEVQRVSQPEATCQLGSSTHQLFSRVSLAFRFAPLQSLGF